MKKTDRTYLTTKDYLVSGETFDLVYCQNHELLITSPTLEPKDLSRYYQSENYISHTDSKKGIFEKLYQAVKKFTVSRKVALIKKENKSEGKLLDIGAGTGGFLLSAKNNNWKVYGVEPNDQARNLSSEKRVVLNKTLEEVSERDFDVITLWHVLEHLPNLEDDINLIHSKLKKEGTLIIAVPNFKSYDAYYYKKYWAAFDVPRHLWHFSKSGIKSLFEEKGFTLKKVKPMLFDSFYVSLLSEKYKTGKQNWIKAFWIGFRSNLHGFVKKEYSSHIYILKKN
ncbi:MAG: class I SAM-dependent methyltransferase [Fulvivirga sp.]